MSQTDKNQQLLNWLNKEKKKDEIELETSKKVFVNDIRNFFSCKQNVDTINQLVNIIIIENHENNTISSSITGLNVIFTGTLNSISRNEAKARANCQSNFEDASLCHRCRWQTRRP